MSNFRGKTGRLPNNVFGRLRCREIGGVYRQHMQALSAQLFNKLPGRLGFTLRTLVNESVLREGHVFLGFTKNGQFVLSYTLHLEADDHSAYPAYVYWLQFWHFIPYRRLRKIAEVRLFGDVEIQQDLLLNVCEWPDNDTKLVVHGYCIPADDEEKRQCYITITAVPPLDPCQDCQQLSYVHSHPVIGLPRTDHTVSSLCLRHSYTVHCRYELAPPYPAFCPRLFLKYNGIVLVNTGDSLVTLSVHLEEPTLAETGHGGVGVGLCGGVCSPRILPSESYPSSSEASPVNSCVSNPLQEGCEEEQLLRSPSYSASPCFPRSPAFLTSPFSGSGSGLTSQTLAGGDVQNSGSGSGSQIFSGSVPGNISGSLTAESISGLQVSENLSASQAVPGNISGSQVLSGSQTVPGSVYGSQAVPGSVSGSQAMPGKSVLGSQAVTQNSAIGNVVLRNSGEMGCGDLKKSDGSCVHYLESVVESRRVKAVDTVEVCVSAVKENLSNESLKIDPNSESSVNGTKNESSVNCTNSESSMKDANNESLMRNTNNESSIRHTNNESLTRDTNNESLIRDTNNESLTRDTNNESLIRGTNNESLIRDTNSESSIRDTNNESSIRHTNNESSTRDTNNESLIRDTNNESSEDGSSCRTLRSGEETAVDVYNFDEYCTPKLDEDEEHCSISTVSGNFPRENSQPSAGCRQLERPKVDSDVYSLDHFMSEDEENSQPAAGGRPPERMDRERNVYDSINITSESGALVNGSGSAMFARRSRYPRVQVRSDGVAVVPQRLLPSLPMSSAMSGIRMWGSGAGFDEAGTSADASKIDLSLVAPSSYSELNVVHAGCGIGTGHCGTFCGTSTGHGSVQGGSHSGSAAGTDGSASGGNQHEGSGLSPPYGIGVITAHRDSHYSDSCTSCSSSISCSPIILQNESKCFTYSVRRYSESLGPLVTRSESPAADVEDDLSLAYHSLLPLEVRGSSYSSLGMITNGDHKPAAPCVAVKQLTLDIEHYLGEAVRTCADWGQRYLAFTDYDVQVLEVCADTAEVIAFVFVLIRARPPREDKQSSSKDIRSIPKLYDTGFKLSWNLQTGSYKTLGVKDLVEVNQAELLRTKRWHPGHNFHRICQALHQKCAIPALPHQTVHVMTNEAVFNGSSLKMLFDRQNYSVILL